MKQGTDSAAMKQGSTLKQLEGPSVLEMNFAKVEAWASWYDITASAKNEGPDEARHRHSAHKVFSKFKHYSSRSMRPFDV